MLNDLLINLRCGRTKAGRPPEGFRTWPDEGEPLHRLELPRVGRRGGGSIEPMTDVCARSSTGDSTKLSSTTGNEELDKPPEATLPNRKGAVWFSALLGLRRMLLAEAAFGRERTGRVTGRFRLMRAVREESQSNGF
jgi:hypothetical protein